jgi:uncharacterized protein YcbK (DUF882 family)
MSWRAAWVLRVNAGTLVLVVGARLRVCRFVVSQAAYSCGLAALLSFFGTQVLQNAVAEGDTRTISLHHTHTDEDITITFKRDGRYDEAALEKLNWFLRDWRKQQETKMDPHLIDLVWEVQRETGSTAPILVVCGYRSPETNAMLRRRSTGVARFSQHMLGHAMDFYIPGVQLDALRAIGLRLQRGGVGFYPTSGSPFVHMDTGGIRMWPRMTREQLVRVFPDQRTVYLPADGRPLAGYELALADIKKRDGSGAEGAVNVADAGGAARSFNPFAKLLHLVRSDDEEDADGASAAAPAPVAAEKLQTRAKAAVATAIQRAEDKFTAEKAKLAQTAARAEEKLAAEKTKLAAVASKVHVISRAEAATAPATPNQIILTRGYWQGLPDGMTAARPAQAVTNAAANALAAVDRPTRTANADATGAIGPFVAPEDRASPEVALAYAAPLEDEPAARAGAASPDAGKAALRAALINHAVTAHVGDNATTVAVKRVGGRTASAIFTVSTKKVSTLLADTTRIDDPWLHAIVVSPSVRQYLCITALGVRDFRPLAELMVKPANSVMMTFAADPNPGLDHEHFSGSAVVFPSTVTYPLRTAQLQ